MLLAISSESLWIDEFWTAHFASLGSARDLFDLLLVPSGSQTPLHFSYYYLWGALFGPSELSLRLANLPLFLLGQLSLFWAMRHYPARFSFLLLTVGSLHPLVWQYANEARPYIMMYAGAQMMLAHLMDLHSTQGRVAAGSPVSSAIFVVGGSLLFGASMLGAFWVMSACVYVVYFHSRHSTWHQLKSFSNIAWASAFLLFNSALAIYYVNSVVHGGGASRLASTTPATVLFAAYELLGLSGIGPGRLQLRDEGLAAITEHWVWLLTAGGIVVATLFRGIREAAKRLGSRQLTVIAILAAAPVLIVVASGFVMHWRVLGRHLIAALPLLNGLFALGLVKFSESDVRRGQLLRFVIPVVVLLVLCYSAASLRFAERHRKDDYRAAAGIALQAAQQGKRVWWAADAIGAHYYRLPGEFDYIGEMTGAHKPLACTDGPGVQSVANMSGDCLRTLSAPDMVILSKPEVFDRSGEIIKYLTLANFAVTEELPAFAVWRPSGSAQRVER